MVEQSRLHTGESLVTSYKKILEKYRFQIYKASSTEEQIQIMREVYQLMRDLSNKMYREDTGFNQVYRSIVALIPSLEDNMNKESILDVKPDFEPNETNRSLELLQSGSAEDTLKFIVNTVRKVLFQKLNQKQNKENTPLEFLDLQKYCSASCDITKQIGDALSLKTTKVALEAGFIKDSHLFNGRKKHYFSFVKVKEELYLVDCTYSQFFYKKDCILERLTVPLLSGCSCGTFMIVTENRRKVAEKLLKDGWIKVTPAVLKAYMDGFAISYRNGLFYERRNDFSFTTDYTAEDYIRFLFKEDNQLYYEDESELGLLKKPLLNTTLQFSPMDSTPAKRV